MKVKELLGLLRFTHSIEVRQDNDFVGYTDSSSPALQGIYEREISNWFVHNGLGGKIDIVIDLKDPEAAVETTERTAQTIKLVERNTVEKLAIAKVLVTSIIEKQPPQMIKDSLEMATDYIDEVMEVYSKLAGRCE